MFRIYGAFFSFLFLFCTYAWAQGEPGEDQISHLSNEQLLPLAQAGNAEAQHYLGRSYYLSGDKVKAKRWLEAAAEQNDVGAMLLLSDSEYSPASKDKHRWYEKIAAQGDVQGMLFNAMQYEEDENSRLAYVWYVLANRVLSEKFTPCKWAPPECYDPTHQGMVETLAGQLNEKDRMAAQAEADALYRSIFKKVGN